MHGLISVALAGAILLALTSCDRPKEGDAFGGDVRRGSGLIAQNGCGACHSVPGVRGARGRVGPSLDHIGTQTILAGTLPNTPANMLTWIKTPQAVRPGDIMPNMGLNDHDARDIAAYLYTLR
jgi:cytochrome c1